MIKYKNYSLNRIANQGAFDEINKMFFKQLTDIVQNLRLNGVVCETNNMEKGLKGQFKEADRLNAKLLVILNNEDLQKGLVNVKDNQTKEETKVDISEIVDYVIGNL